MRAKVLVLGLAYALLARSAPAQERGSAPEAARLRADDRAAAQALLDEASRLLALGEYDAACPKLEASQELAAHIDTLLALADCYEHVGRYASAWRSFRQAAETAELQHEPEAAGRATSRARALARKLSRLTISVPAPSRVPGLVVRLGDRMVPAKSFETPLAVDSGKQLLEAEAPGYEAFRKALHVLPGASDHVVVPTLLPAADDEGSTLRTLGVVTSAVGIAAVGTGAVFGMLAAGKTADSLEHCSEAPLECSREGEELREDADDYSTAAMGTLAAGGSLILTGIVLYVAAPSKPAHETTAVTLSPLIGSRWGASVEGWW